MTTALHEASFEAQIKRIYFSTGAKSRVELADFLGVSLSAVLDAKKRDMVPSEWLVTLTRAKNVNPEWILTGNGPWCFTEPPAPGQYELHDQFQERLSDEAALRRLSSRALAEELLRRIAVAQTVR